MFIETAQPVSDATIQLAEGVTRTWAYDGRLVIYTISSVRRDAIDALMNDSEQAFAGVGTGQRLHVMFDLSAHGVSLTPYYRSRLVEQQSYFEHHPGAFTIIVVTSAGLLNRLFGMVGDVLVRRLGSDKFAQRFFNQREDALKWLDNTLVAKTARH